MTGSRGALGHTFCPRLWGEAFVDSDGTVYPCCDRPGCGLGNIHEQTLDEIMDGEEIARMRSMSMASTLPCFEKCRRLDKRSLMRPDRPPAGPGGYSRRVKLLVGRACNIACVMCPQDHDDLRSLDFERLTSAIDFERVERVDIQGGEPLAIPAARALLAHLSGLGGQRVVLLTNGMLLDEEMVDLLVRASPFIHISLNASTAEMHEKVNRGSRWDTVVRNIDRLIRHREATGSDMALLGHMTILPLNVHQVPEFVRDHRGLGFDAIDFSYDRAVPNFLSRDPERQSRLAAAVTAAIRALPSPEPKLQRRLKHAGFEPIVNATPLRQLGLHP